VASNASRHTAAKEETPAKARSSPQRLQCPECHSSRIWKDGLRYLPTETGNLTIQRYICRDCGRRFSETAPYLRPNRRGYNRHSRSSTRQVCVALAEGSKNLAEVETRTEKRAAGATTHAEADLKGKLVTFIWELKKQGLKDRSIETYHQYTLRLAKCGADLRDPESVKEVIAQQAWSQSTKALAISSYSKFLEINGGTWIPPKCKIIRKLPFIPLESELDQLISGANRKLAAFLQLLKETGMRYGEAWRLKWIDIDFTNHTLTLNEPEKYGKPRMFKISPTLLAMVQVLPKQSDILFGTQNPRNYGRIYLRYRKRMASKLQNPRLTKITFHTFRHWKATMEYHKTKDILHVMQLLGHRDINTTLLYTQLVSFESDDYHSAVAKTTEKAEQLVEAGFEYVCTTPQDVMLFRKRK